MNTDRGRSTSGEGIPLLFAFLMVATLFFNLGVLPRDAGRAEQALPEHPRTSARRSLASSDLGIRRLLPAGLPSALLIRRIGYQKGILVGLLVVATGAFLFIPAGLHFKTFGAFLGALFVLSSGLACIETAANPTSLCSDRRTGPPDACRSPRPSTRAPTSSLPPSAAPHLRETGRRRVRGGLQLAAHSVRGARLRGAGRVRGLLVHQAAGHRGPGADGSSDKDASDHQAALIRQPHFVWASSPSSSISPPKWE